MCKYSCSVIPSIACPQQMHPSTLTASSFNSVLKWLPSGISLQRPLGSVGHWWMTSPTMALRNVWLSCWTTGSETNRANQHGDKLLKYWRKFICISWQMTSWRCMKQVSIIFHSLLYVLACKLTLAKRMHAWWERVLTEHGNESAWGVHWTTMVWSFIRQSKHMTLRRYLNNGCCLGGFYVI